MTYGAINWCGHAAGAGDGDGVGEVADAAPGRGLLGQVTGLHFGLELVLRHRAMVKAMPGAARAPIAMRGA